MIVIRTYKLQNYFMGMGWNFYKQIKDKNLGNKTANNKFNGTNEISMINGLANGLDFKNSNYPDSNFTNIHELITHINITLTLETANVFLCIGGKMEWCLVYYTAFYCFLSITLFGAKLFVLKIMGADWLFFVISFLLFHFINSDKIQTEREGGWVSKQSRSYSEYQITNCVILDRTEFW